MAFAPRPRAALGFRQLFFTYAVPIIPIFFAWDGQASMPRIYSLEDLDELMEGMRPVTPPITKGPMKPRA